MYSINQQLSNIIDRLNEAVNVCYEAPNNEDQGYPYATGFARSAMSSSAEQLAELQEQLQESMWVNILIKWYFYP